jgi:hypothetical protein
MKACGPLFVLLASLPMMSMAAADPPEVRSLPDLNAAVPATLADFKGLVGSWISPQGALDFSGVIGGQIVGHMALMGEDKSPRNVELWVIRQEGEHVVVRLKHFAPDLKAREDKDEWNERGVAGVSHNIIYLGNLTLVIGRDTLQLFARPLNSTSSPPRLVTYSFKRAE